MKRLMLGSIISVLCSQDAVDGGVVVADAPPKDAPTPLTFEVHEFSEGPAKGFKYTVPEYSSDEAGLAEAVRRYGAGVVVSLLNGQVLGRIRTKVKNDLNLVGKKPAEVQQIIAKTMQSTGGMLFSQQAATEWRPDVRELTPKQLFKKAQECFQAGDVAGGTQYLQKMTEALQHEASAAMEAGSPAPAVAAA